MIRAYLKEPLHWLQLAFFKPVTLQEEARRLTRKQALVIYFKTFSVGFLFILILLTIIGIVCKLIGISFEWVKAFREGLIVGLLSGVISGRILGLDRGLVFGLAGGLLFGLCNGPDFGLGSGLVFGLAGGLVWGWRARSGRWVFWLIGGLLFGLSSGMVFGRFLGPVWGSDNWGSEVLKFLMGFLFTYPLLFFQLYHLPLPFLSRRLLELAQADRERGLVEISFIAANRPFQRRAAQKALTAILTNDLRLVDSIEKLARTGELFRAFPAGAKHLPAGFDEARRRISSLAANARRYGSGALPTKLILLQTMAKDLEDFRLVIAQTPLPIGVNFYPIAERWLEMVKATEEELRRRLEFTPIKNPFIAGNALQEVDGKLFKGRRDIIRALEENIIHPQQRTALLLYGRRRIGKSSTLLNLPNLISAAYIPVYIDLQEAKWREGDGMFCYHLTKAVYRELFQAELSYRLKQPAESEFEQRPFTELTKYLDSVEVVSRRTSKQILITFDEYERMEAGIEDGRITIEVLNQLRHLVQHRQGLVLLFSGSHRFEELKTVNWADYLINTKTLELSFLEPEEARDLMERPVPEFNMRYEPGVVDRILELTHNHPYLLQAIGSELVNQMNTHNRMTATMNDLIVVVQKTLVSTQAYFHNTWADECSDEEREVLLTLVAGEEIEQDHHWAALQSLSRKEIVEKDQNGYRLSVELLRFWILKNQIGTDELRGEAPVTIYGHH